ncbi:MAG: hypothetical protein IKV94_06000 [Clostridia bacterium]|nr:hypothetical protein [Clostridia bacterium]
MESSNKRKGVSLIVVVVFSLVITAIITTIAMLFVNIVFRNESQDNKVEENYLVNLPKYEPKVDYSLNYTVKNNVATINIQDNSGDLVMFACMKVVNEIVPNVAEADWKYTNYFEVEEGEYYIYSKDWNGNISNATIVNVEF